MYSSVKLHTRLSVGSFWSAIFLLLFTTSLVQANATLPTTQQRSSAAYVMIWSAFNGGGARNAVNTSEGFISTQTVGRLSRLWQSKLPAVADSSPTFVAHVATANGFKNLLFLTTKAGSLQAIDVANGQIVWHQETSGPNITTSSPAIDPSWKYVYSYGVDGKVHRYNVGTGAETINSIWPATMTLMPNDEKGSATLNIGNGYLYMTMSGYNGDGGHYNGHAVAVNLATGRKTVFNVLCANIHTLLDNNPSDPNYCASIQAGVWARAGVVIDPQSGYVYITSGNGPFNANTGGHDYGDTVMKLSADLTSLVDSYTPSNYSTLAANDQDLGSDAPTILPTQTGSRTPYLIVQGGKDNTLRLLNRNNLGNQAHPGPNHVGGELQAITLPQGCDIDTQMTAWQASSNETWLFVANDCGLSAFKVVTDTQGRTTLQLAYTNGNSGSSPLVANNVLYVQGKNGINAMSPTTGNVLWNSNQSSANGGIGSLHWQSPIVINGQLYAPDNDGNVTAYGLK
ncbi:MAG: hypothetical protein NVS4B12_02990 [Ktedonobacteraceae bacterium]